MYPQNSTKFVAISLHMNQGRVPLLASPSLPFTTNEGSLKPTYTSHIEI